jgi:hypothetical protein
LKIFNTAGKFVSANHILQNFLSAENFPECKWSFVGPLARIEQAIPVQRSNQLSYRDQFPRPAFIEILTQS